MSVPVIFNEALNVSHNAMLPMDPTVTTYYNLRRGIRSQNWSTHPSMTQFGSSMKQSAV